MAVYQTDPEMADDSGFVTATLGHLVEGSPGRLLDARRTPITLLSVDANRGCFTVQIDAFEDRGARWELGLEEIARFQFPREAPTASPERTVDLTDARDRFDRQLCIDAAERARAPTQRAIAAAEAEARRHVLAGGILDGLDPVKRYVAERRGEPQLTILLETFLDQRGVLALDQELAGTFVSNPRSGELIKGHAMVLARLGLCPYRGRVLRDPEALTGRWSFAERRRHIVLRLGFMRALFTGLGMRSVTLYRAAATERPLKRRPETSFVSATFSAQVAEAHFQGGPLTQAAIMWRQTVPAERLFMTFLETAALNDRYLEAEAVLTGDPDSSTSERG